MTATSPPPAAVLRGQYLQVMGIDEWRLRDSGLGPDLADGPAVAEIPPELQPALRAEASVASGEATAVQPTPVAAREQLAVTPGAPAAGRVEADEGVAIPVTTPAPVPALALNWTELADAVAGCTQCDLHRGRNRTVFGSGKQGADWMIIGDAPSADEDRDGEPFVARSGQLLDAMLRSIGCEREQVYITNVLKCRPSHNRDPSTHELQCCSAYLERQIELVAPRAILAVGRIVAQHLLASSESVGTLRQQVHSYKNIPLVVSYHPGYLLRSAGEKRAAWDDLQRLAALLKAAR